MTNCYYNPEKYLLKPIIELNEENLCYEYNTVVIWEHEVTHKRYWMQDSGCSCPEPFEECTGLDKLNPLPETGEELCKLILDFPCKAENKIEALKLL